MKALLILMTGLICTSAFALRAPSREVWLNGTLTATKAHASDFKLKGCVSNKFECVKMMEDQGASDYILKKDAAGCEATDDDDTATIGCFLQD